MKPYSLLIKPVGGDCNLRCVYCFYLRTRDLVYPREARHRMTEETLRRVVEGLMRERFPVSAFCWQGGEPTLAGLEFFRRVVAVQQEFGARGQAVSNSIQTNGALLDDEWADFFRRYRWLVGVSLDGPAALHDLHRYDAGGKGSHERALKGIEALTRHGVEFNILAVVNKQTARRVRDVYASFLDRGFSHLQFIPILERGPGAGGVADYVMTPEEYGVFLCELWDLWTKPGIPVVSIRDFEAWIERLMGGPPGLCTHDSACDQYVMVEHNGDIYPCDFFCDPQFRLGNVHDIPLGEIYRKPKHRGFALLKTAYPDECYACRWLDLCHGGCVKDRMGGAGPFQGQKACASNYFCQSYKMFFEHAYEGMVALKDRLWEREIGGGEPPAPSRSGSPTKAGRNDPCPCGSGRKFKDCCQTRHPSARHATMGKR